MFNPEEIKKEFPIFRREVHGRPLVYLDSAATAQKPQVVLDAIVEYYSNHNANVHRGMHTLGDESTRIYAKARETTARFVGAEAKELVFVRNTTEAINLVGYAWARRNLKEGDLIVTSELEHHSDMVVWQEVVRDTGAHLTFVPVTEDGQIDVEHMEQMLDSLGYGVRLVALTYVSNTTGAVLDVKRVVELVHKYAKQAKILIDAAQAVPQMPVNFKDVKVDFLAFSGHKLYGPMGIGGLVVKREVLSELEPFLVGGGMIDEVHLQGSTFAQVPDRFDAGTPNVAGAVGLAAAVEYLEKLGMDRVEAHSRQLVETALSRLSDLSGLRIVGPVSQRHGSMINRLGSVAFVLDGVHAHDAAQVLDAEGVAVRSGHHCTMPLHERLGLQASIRASFGVYNNESDIDRLVEELEKAKKMFGV